MAKTKKEVATVTTDPETVVTDDAAVTTDPETVVTDDAAVTTEDAAATAPQIEETHVIKPPDPEENVEVMIHADPGIQGMDADQEFFSVNFNDYMLRTDEIVRVPKPLKEVIDRREEAKIKARHYAKAHAFKEPK